MILDFLAASDEKRQRAIRKVLATAVSTTHADILVVTLSDKDAIKKFNTAARFWASVEVLKKIGDRTRTRSLPTVLSPHHQL